MYYVSDGLNGSLDLFWNETPKPFLLKVMIYYLYFYSKVYAGILTTGKVNAENNLVADIRCMYWI